MLGIFLELIDIVLNPIGFVLDIVKDSVVPSNGAVVYCKIGPIEHTGIYINDYRQILHRNRHGFIELVTPEEFTFFHGDTIYVSCHDDESVRSDRAASRALMRYESGSWEPYDIVNNNCHTFVVTCATGDDQSHAFTFFMLEVELKLATQHNNWRMWKTEDHNYVH